MVVPEPVSTLTSSSQSKSHIPLISFPAEELFRRVLSRFLSSTMSTCDGLAIEHAPAAVQRAAKPIPSHGSGLKKIPPYWYPYTTMAKGRWLGREILEVVSTEFRDRSMEYYVRSAVLNSGHKMNHLIVAFTPEIRLGVGRHYDKRQSG
jgi:hypothetical protein